MGREDPFEVRNSLVIAGEGNAQRAALNRAALQITVDLIDHLVLAGYAYHVQIGTEDAGVASTTSIDDELVWMLVDQNDGYATIPLLCSVAFDFADTSVNGDLMLELDMDKNRWSSGGTAFTPENLAKDGSRSYNGSAYVGTDITTAAKSAVPASVEFARKALTEDAVTDPTTGKMAYNPVLYSAKLHPLAKVVDTGSVIVHFGAGTADFTGYGILQVAQVDDGLLI